MTHPRPAPLRLRLRLAAGRMYDRAFHAAGRWLARLPADSAVQRLKQRLADRVRPVPRKKVEVLYASLARLQPEAFFIQIGANDGKMADPLRDSVIASRWRGILVEPVPYLYRRLVENYPRRAGLVFENVAIADRGGSRPFYYLRAAEGEADVPDWHIGLGSFLKESVLAHAGDIPGLEQRLVEEPVACVTFAELCARHHVESIDILNIDTEGYDYEILKTLDLDALRPGVLAFEYHLLSAADRADCFALLQRQGYEIMTEGLDAICIDARTLTNTPLYAAWRLLRDVPGVPA